MATQISNRAVRSITYLVEQQTNIKRPLSLSYLRVIHRWNTLAKSQQCSKTVSVMTSSLSETFSSVVFWLDVQELVWDYMELTTFSLPFRHLKIMRVDIQNANKIILLTQWRTVLRFPDSSNLWMMLPFWQSYCCHQITPYTSLNNITGAQGTTGSYKRQYVL